MIACVCAGMDTYAAQRLVRLNPQLLSVSVEALARPGAAALASMLGLQPDELRRLVARFSADAFHSSLHHNGLSFRAAPGVRGVTRYMGP